MPIGLQLTWFLATVLLVIGLRGMRSPSRARQGIWYAALGIGLATVSMYFHPDVNQNRLLIILAILLGSLFALVQARRVAMTDMPQMIALYNGLGGAAGACIGMSVLLNVAQYSAATKALAVLGALIGCISFSGSTLAFLRLRGYFARHEGFARKQVAYLANVAIVLLLGLILATSETAHPVLLFMFAALGLSFGVMMTLPTASADIPVLVSMYNALTGLSVAIDGLVLDNPPMMVAGTLVFAAGSLLTRLMARSVNRRLSEIMYSGLGIVPDSDSSDSKESHRDHVNTIDSRDAAIDMAFARRVVIVPGYGMATAQAQHKLRELTQLLEERGVRTGFAIHPVAGRMPGHMNVLLAEAGVPYEKIQDLSEINAEFSDVDVALVVGANDIVNPAANDDQDSPLSGMPILEVTRARRVIVIKRGTGPGYAGIDNRLLFSPITRVLFGDARDIVQAMILAIKSLE